MACWCMKSCKIAKLKVASEGIVAIHTFQLYLETSICSISCSPHDRPVMVSFSRGYDLPSHPFIRQPCSPVYTNAPNNIQYLSFPEHLVELPCRHNLFPLVTKPNNTPHTPSIYIPDSWYSVRALADPLHAFFLYMFPYLSTLWYFLGSSAAERSRLLIWRVRPWSQFESCSIRNRQLLWDECITWPAVAMMFRVLGRRTSPEISARRQWYIQLLS